METVGKGTFQFDQKTADSTNIRSRQGFLETNVALFMRMCIVDGWRSLGASVNPLLREYYKAYPAKFRFPYNDDEAEIDGFADYAAKHGVIIKEGHIVDPWGSPVHFVIDHDKDLTLKAQGYSYNLSGQDPDLIGVALLFDRSLDTKFDTQWRWSVENGYIQKRQVRRKSP